MKPDVLQDVNNTVRIAEVTCCVDWKSMHFGLIWALSQAQPWNSTLAQGQCVTFNLSLHLVSRLYNCDNTSHLERILYT